MDNETIELVARAICCDGHDGAGNYCHDGSRCGAMDHWSVEAQAVLTALTAAGWQRVPDGHVVAPVDKLERIRTSMAMLQQNSEGCAANHFAGDYAEQGLPGWLAGTCRDVDALKDMIAAAKDDV